MDLLSDILSVLELKGTLYFRTSFTSPWSIRVPAFENVARFHFAHKGRCYVRIDNVEEPVLLDQGDLVIITRGESHVLYCDPVTADNPTHLDEVVEKSGFDGSGTLVYGEFGMDHETQLVCGHFSFNEEASHPVIDQLPSHIHVPSFSPGSSDWLESTLKIIGAEAGRHGMGGDLIALKLSEIIFAQALRIYLNEKGRTLPVFAGFADPKLSRALDAIHNNPAQNWTLDELAKIAGMSRTTFAQRFSNQITLTPMNYLSLWRMQKARKILTDTKLPVIEVALKSGYSSEAAFSRVFKRFFDLPPASYRTLQQQLDAAE